MVEQSLNRCRETFDFWYKKRYGAESVPEVTPLWTAWQAAWEFQQAEIDELYVK
jgi:hypothetical protein